jgi:predicted RNA binding protein YcfA (HicA-like mRNA interferase family)
VPPLPIISGSTCIAALAKIGYRSVRQKGSHVRLERTGRPPVTVPLHSEIDRGTLRSIIRTTELSIDEFVKLVG